MSSAQEEDRGNITPTPANTPQSGSPETSPERSPTADKYLWLYFDPDSSDYLMEPPSASRHEPVTVRGRPRQRGAQGRSSDGQTERQDVPPTPPAPAEPLRSILRLEERPQFPGLAAEVRHVRFVDPTEMNKGKHRSRSPSPYPGASDGSYSDSDSGYDADDEGDGQGAGPRGRRRSISTGG